jgi:hypothetical protein
MTKHFHPARQDNLRRAVAQEAARLMAEHGIQDFYAAKRKAAERLGVSDNGGLPKNSEIEAALAEYQRLFEADTHEQSLYAQRLAALSAMRILSEFAPRLIGPVLSGTATAHSEVQLHLFSDNAETVVFKLIDRGIAHEVFEKRIKMNTERVLTCPALHFDIDEQAVEATIFPADGIRQAPLSPVDGKPMRRADAAELEVLLNA